MDEDKKKIKLLREASSRLGVEPEEFLQSLEKLRREVAQLENEIKKMKIEVN